MGRVLPAAAIAGCIAGCSFRSPTGSDGAPATDAVPFNTAACPPAFNVTLPSFPLARYRIITTNAGLRTQLGQCTVSNVSHLVALESSAEAVELDGVLLQVQSPPTNRWYYAGGVQKRNQALPGAQWWWLTGGEVDPALWATQQPNDGDGIESNQEQVHIFDANQARLIDASGMTGYGAVCECDGKSMDPMLASELPP